MLKLVKDQNESTFTDDVLKLNKLAVVDFWAPWCGPCNQMAPVVEAFAEDQPDVAVFKVDVDQNPNLSKTYKIQSIPTIILFENGKEKERLIGSVGKQALLDLIKQ
jgi:thioredoxin 1